MDREKKNAERYENSICKKIDDLFKKENATGKEVASLSSTVKSLMAQINKIEADKEPIRHNYATRLKSIETLLKGIKGNA